MTGVIAAIVGALGGGSPVLIEDATVEAFALSPDTAIAGYNLRNDGRITLNQNGIESDEGFWLTPQVGMNTYEVRSNGGPWLNLGISRFFNIAQSVVGNNTVNLLLEIRPVGGSVISSADITLTAEVI